MILRQSEDKVWRTDKGESLDSVMAYYGVDIGKVKPFLNGSDFLVKSKYSTIVKIEKAPGGGIKVTPYHSDKNKDLTYVYLNDKLNPLSDEAEKYMDYNTQFLDLKVLKANNLDYFIEKKGEITIIGLISALNREEFKGILDFREDLKVMAEKNTLEDKMTNPNYLMVVKAYDDITLQNLKLRLKKARQYMKDLRIYHTGVKEFTLMSKYPINQLIAENLIVSFKFQTLEDIQVDDVERLRATLFKEIENNRVEEEENTIRGYFTALHNKTDETVEHSERMRRIVTLIGQELMLEDKEFETLWKMSTVHDVGKLAIEGKIINKPAKLTENEYSIVKKHTILGYEMMGGIKTYEEARLSCLQHHEMWNGNGYPNNIKGTDINPLVRIVTVADCIDAMASKRVYKDAYDYDIVKGELKRCQGTQFCPQSAKAAIDIFEDIMRLY